MEVPALRKFVERFEYGIAEIQTSHVPSRGIQALDELFHLPHLNVLLCWILTHLGGAMRWPAIEYKLYTEPGASDGGRSEMQPQPRLAPAQLPVRQPKTIRQSPMRLLHQQRQLSLRQTSHLLLPPKKKPHEAVQILLLRRLPGEQARSRLVTGLRGPVALILI